MNARIWQAWLPQKDGLGIWWLALLFHSGVWVSKSLYPLWLEMQGVLPYFALSYAALSLTGVSAFWLGRWAAKVSLQRALRLGCLLASTGLALRIFPQWPLVLLSGLLAGFGVALVSIVLSTWPFTAGEARQRFYGYTLQAMYLARGAVVMLAGLGLLALAEGGMRGMLLLAAVLLLLPLWICTVPDGEGKVRAHAPGGNISPVVRWLLVYVFINGAMAGFVLPYLPVALHRAGLEAGEVLMVLGAASLVVVVTQPLLTMQARRMPRFFLCATAALALSTAMLANIGTIWLFCLWVMLRFVAANAVAYSQRALEMEMIARAQAAQSMGTLQSAFRLGDMLSGMVAGLLWAAGLEKYAFPLLGVLIAVNGIFFLGIYRRFRESAF